MNKITENLLIIILYYVSMMFLAVIPYFTIVYLTPNFSDEFLITAFIVSYFTTLVVLSYFIYKEFKTGIKSFISSFKRNVLIIVGVFVFAIFANVAANYITELLGATGSSENQSDLVTMMVNANNQELIVLAGIFILIAPIIEEIVFRKGLFGLVKELMIRFYTYRDMELSSVKSGRTIGLLSILISSVAFALIHINGDYIFLIQYGSLALLLGTSYYLSKENIFVPILIHMAQNALATVQILYLINEGLI